jgi:ABC-2 type transport system ATP-binding protein
VAGIDLRVPRGSVYGFLGPNGAGKTTTIRMLLGLVRPTSGEAALLGRPVRPGAVNLDGVGAVVERPAFYPYLSALDNLRLLAITHGTAPREATSIAEDALAWAGLTAVARRKVGGFSTGMGQRLALAHAMLHRPSLVVLDEPTNGLDPAGVVEVRELISGMARDGVTVFLSSHVLTEVEQVCSHVAVLRAGRVVADGPNHELLGGAGAITVRFDKTDEAEAALRALAAAGLSASQPVPGSPDPADARTLIVSLAADEGSRVARTLAEAGLFPAAIIPQRQTLESVFLELTRDAP